VKKCGGVYVPEALVVIYFVCESGSEISKLFALYYIRGAYENVFYSWCIRSGNPGNFTRFQPPEYEQVDFGMPPLCMNVLYLFIY
jgi:hypothetical protein